MCVYRTRIPPLPAKVMCVYRTRMPPLPAKVMCVYRTMMPPLPAKANRSITPEQTTWKSQKYNCAFLL